MSKEGKKQHWNIQVFTQRTKVVFFSMLLLSDLGIAAGRYEVKIAQQQPLPATKPQNTNRAPSEAEAKLKPLLEKAKQLSQEALQLASQPNSASRRQAITKYEELVKIWRLPELRAVYPKESRIFEAFALSSIGSGYANLSENPKAVEYSEQALAILRELTDPKARELEANILYIVALPYLKIGQKQKALEALEQARSLYSAENKTEDVVNTWSATATIYVISNEFKKGIEPLNQALKIQKANNLPAQAQTIKDLADLYSQLGQSDKALKSYNVALENYRQTNDLFGQAGILSSIGSFYSQKGERQQADKYFQEALQLQLSLEKQLQKTVSPGVVPDKSSEASAQQRIARYRYLAQQISILETIATSYYVLGDSEQQITYLNQRQTLAHQLGNTEYEADSIASIATVYSELGEKQKALGLFDQALKMQRSINGLSGEAEIFNKQAEILLTLGEPQKALDLYNQTLNIYQRLQNPWQEALTRSKIAELYSNLGDYDSSIIYYNQPLEISQRLENPILRMAILGHIGNVFLKRGRTASLSEDAKNADYDKALDYFKQAREIEQKEGIVINEVATLFSVARTNEFKKNYPQAIAAAQRALTLSRQHELKYWERSSLTVLGRVYKAAGDYQKALASTRESLLLSQKVGDLSEQATILQIQGEIYTLLKQPQQALAAYNQELVLRQKIQDQAGEAFSLYNLAVTERDRGNLQQALTQIKKTIEIVEGIRGKVTNQDLRTSYFATKQDYYKFYIDLLMRLHKKDSSIGYNADALHISESSRARGLLELLTEAKVGIRKGVDPKLLAEEQRLQELIDAKEKLRFNLVNSHNIDDPTALAKVQKLEKEVSALLNQQKELQTKIRTNSPKYAALKYPEPLKLPEIQQQLDRDTILLEYSLGKEHSYLWAVTQTSITSYELPKRAEIEAAAKEFYQLLKNPGNNIYTRGAIDVGPGSATGSTNVNASKLSQMLLQPVASQLGNKRLLIVSDGALQYVPFAALPNVSSHSKGNDGQEANSQPLLVNHEIINFPSATAVALQRFELKGRKKAPLTLAILADPVFSATDERITGKAGTELNTSRQLEQSTLQQAAKNINRSGWVRLDNTRKEAQTIAQLVPVSNRLEVYDFDANYNWANNPQLQQYRYLHFATHGFADSTNPELSGIVLSLVDKLGKPVRGYLRLGDIFNLNISAELLVLSACETGLGKEVSGEGLVGLTRGLMYAGAARVVVSLWQVHDEGTSILMQEFYKQLLQQGKSPTAALRTAQLSMWQQQKWHNPYYWSAFTFQGEWQ